MVDLDNSKTSKDFSGCGEQSHEIADWHQHREWTGLRQKDEWQTSYVDPGGRWRGGGAEAKQSAKEWFFKLYFIHATFSVNHIARYSGHPGYK
jgi:hypothetical protein